MKQKIFQQNVTKYCINISLQNAPVSKTVCKTSAFFFLAIKITLFHFQQQKSLQNSGEFALRGACKLERRESTLCNLRPEICKMLQQQLTLGHNNFAAQFCLEQNIMSDK
jgi:hypothetical protein